MVDAISGNLGRSHVAYHIHSLLYVGLINVSGPEERDAFSVHVDESCGGIEGVEFG